MSQGVRVLPDLFGRVVATTSGDDCYAQKNER